MYYSYVEIEYVAASFSPPRTDFPLKLLTAPNESMNIHQQDKSQNMCHNSTDENSNSITAPFQNNSCKGTKSTI